mgnify:CR=1 FL=1
MFYVCVINLQFYIFFRPDMTIYTKTHQDLSRYQLYGQSQFQKLLLIIRPYYQQQNQLVRYGGGCYYYYHHYKGQSNCYNYYY